MDDDIILQICMEGVDAQQDHYYMVQSLILSDLINPLPDPPNLRPRGIFRGHKSMGCGFYDSKIVFAGGQSSNQELHNGFISYDMRTEEVCYEPYPLMQEGKLKPLVYQLNTNLYVMDTKSGYRVGAFEYFYPPKQEWHNLRQPMDKYDPTSLPLQHSYGYPSVVLGNTCYLTVPHCNSVFFHHPNITYKSWLPGGDEPLPFSGMATFYQQDGFDDLVIISFTKGHVEAHQFDLSDTIFKHHQQLFMVPPSQSDAEMCGYFASFGNGIFTLTASDNVFLHVCTFKIEIVGLQPDERMKLTCTVYTTYQYRTNALCPGFDIIGVVGCFAQSPNLPADKRADEIFNNRYKRFGKRYDDNPRTIEFNGSGYEIPSEYPDGGVLACLPIEEQDVFCVI